MPLSIKLEVFEGPLDLLMHLIEKNKVDIYDIPIVEITDQYLEYLHAMEQSDMNVMSEFIVMAATLIDIKCRMLLPKEVNEEGEEEDPRAELVERLLEHKKYRLMAQELADREFDASRVFYKEPTVPGEVQRYSPPPDLDALFGDVTLLKLQQIFQEVMRHRDDRIDPQRSRFGTIRREPVSLKEKIGSLVQYAKQHERFSFRELLNSSSTKTEVVVTFLAVLELMKAGRIRTWQADLFDDILIEAGEGAFDEELDLEELEDFEE